MKKSLFNAAYCRRHRCVVVMPPLDRASLSPLDDEAASDGKVPEMGNCRDTALGVDRRAFALFETAAQGGKDIIDGRWLSLPEHRERIAKLLRSFDR